MQKYAKEWKAHKIQQKLTVSEGSISAESQIASLKQKVEILEKESNTLASQLLISKTQMHEEAVQVGLFVCLFLFFRSLLSSSMYVNNKIQRNEISLIKSLNFYDFCF